MRKMNVLEIPEKSEGKNKAKEETQKSFNMQKQGELSDG